MVLTLRVEKLILQANVLSSKRKKLIPTWCFKIALCRSTFAVASVTDNKSKLASISTIKYQIHMNKQAGFEMLNFPSSPPAVAVS